MRTKFISILSICLFISIHMIGQDHIEIIEKTQQTTDQILQEGKKNSSSDSSQVSKNTTVKSFNPIFEFKLLGCTGNTREQTVTIEVLISQKTLPNLELLLWTGSKKPVAYDESGNGYDYKEAFFPQGKDRAIIYVMPLFTDVPIKGKIVFRNVLPATERFRFVTGSIEFKNADGQGNDGHGMFEIRNLTIDWQ